MIYKKSQIFIKKLSFTIAFIWLLVPFTSLATSSPDSDKAAFTGFSANFGTNPRVDVLIVTVEHVEDQGRTPVSVTIHESLRGLTETGKREVQWRGANMPPLDVYYSCENYNSIYSCPSYVAWWAELAPKIGEKYIIEVYSPRDPLKLNAASAYPYSQENYNYILQVINDNPPPKDWASVSILFLGLFSFILLFLPRSRMVEGRWTKRLFKLNLLTPVAVIILFSIWNQSVDPLAYSIRVDLLIIPVILIITILSVLRYIIVLFKKSN